MRLQPDLRRPAAAARPRGHDLSRPRQHGRRAAFHEFRLADAATLARGAPRRDSRRPGPSCRSTIRRPGRRERAWAAAGTSPTRRRWRRCARRRDRERGRRGGAVCRVDVLGALLSRARRLTAVGGSDEHTVDDPADRVIGRPTTVVWAARCRRRQSSPACGRDACTSGPAARPGRCSTSAPSMRTAPRRMGGVSAGRPARLVADVERAAGQTLEWIADGQVLSRVPVDAAALILDAPPAARWVRRRAARPDRAHRVQQRHLRAALTAPRGPTRPRCVGPPSRPAHGRQGAQAAPGLPQKRARAVSAVSGLSENTPSTPRQ